MNVIIDFCVPKGPIKHVSHDTHATFWSGVHICPDLDPLLSIRSTLSCYILHSLGSLLAKFRLAAAIGPVSVGDKEKIDGFDLLTWPWPDMWPFKKINYQSWVLVETFPFFFFSLRSTTLNFETRVVALLSPFAGEGGKTRKTVEG